MGYGDVIKLLWGGSTDGVEHADDEDDDDVGSLGGAAQQQQQHAAIISEPTATGMHSTAGIKHRYHLLAAHRRAVSGSLQRHSQ